MATVNLNREGGWKMADDKYDKVLFKAKVGGVSSLNSNDLETFKKLLKESSQRGREAQALVK